MVESNIKFFHWYFKLEIQYIEDLRALIKNSKNIFFGLISSNNSSTCMSLATGANPAPFEPWPRNPSKLSAMVVIVVSMQKPGPPER